MGHYFFSRFFFCISATVNARKLSLSCGDSGSVPIVRFSIFQTLHPLCLRSPEPGARTLALYPAVICCSLRLMHKPDKFRALFAFHLHGTRTHTSPT